MGQKVNPLAMRPDHSYVGWYTTNKKFFKKCILIDYQLGQLATKILGRLNFAKIGVERIGRQTNVTIYTHKPGVLVSRDSKTPLVEEYKKQIKEHILPDTPFTIIINDQAIKADSSAIIIANNLTASVEEGVSYRSATKKTIANFMRTHPAGGIKVRWAGRVNGAKIAREEKYQDGTMPLSTLREEIDFAYAVAHTKVGTVTCRVFIHLPSSDYRREERKKSERGFFDRPRPDDRFKGTSEKFIRKPQTQIKRTLETKNENKEMV